MSDIEKVLQSVLESISVINDTNNSAVRTMEGLLSYIQKLEDRIVKLENEIENIHSSYDSDD